MGEVGPHYLEEDALAATLDAAVTEQQWCFEGIRGVVVETNIPILHLDSGA